MGRKILISVCLAALVFAGFFAVLYLMNEGDGPGAGGDGVPAVDVEPDGELRGGFAEAEVDGEESDAASEASEAETGEEPEAVTVEPSGPVSIHGRVLDLDGAGVAGARVLAINSAKWTATWQSLQTRFAGNQNPFSAVQSIREVFAAEAKKLPQTRSGEDGSYALHDLAAGEYRLFALHGEFLPSLENWAVLETPPVEVDIHVVPGYSIGGKIVDEEGQPVAGATVRGVPSESGERKGMGQLMQYVLDIFEGKVVLDDAGETDAQGVFRLSSLEPIPYDLAITHTGFATRRVQKVPAGSDNLLIPLDRGIAVRGRVTDPDGQAAAGVEVVLEASFPKGAMNNPMAMFSADVDLLGERTARTRSGDDGAFLLTGVEAGKYQLSLRSADHPDYEDELEVTETVDLGEIALPGSFAIGGVVRDPTGRALKDARVWANESPAQGQPVFTMNTDTESLVETKSDGDGRFLLGPLGEGDYVVRASAEGLTTARVDGVQAGTVGLELTLEEGSSIVGVILDAENGQPVAGVQVVVINPTKRTKSDEEGYFEIHGLAAPARGTSSGPFSQQTHLQMMHPDFEPHFQAITPSSHPDGELKEFRLKRLQRITGFVVDADGEPVRNARVRTMVPGMPEAIAVFASGGAGGAAFTGEDGFFAISKPGRMGMPDGRVEIVASHPLFATGRAPVPADGGDVEIVLTRGSTLEGRVVDPSGNGVRGAVIRMKRTLELAGEMAMIRQLFPERAGKAYYSGTDGAYVIEQLEPGTYDFEVFGMGFAKKVVNGHPIGEGTFQLDFVLDPGASIEGRVIDPAGNPLQGVEVVALLESRSEPTAENSGQNRMMEQMMLYSASGFTQVKTAASGGFVLENLPEGEFSLIVRKQGFEAVRIDAVRAGQNVDDIVLPRTAVLEGVVISARTGEPVERFRVLPASVAAGGEPQIEYQSVRQFESATGEFIHDGMKTGRWEISVQADGFVAYTETIDLRSGERKRLEIALQEGASIRGVVVQEGNGEPIADVTVNAFPQGDQAQNPFRRVGMSNQETRSADDGSFTMKGLADGKYAISVNHQDYYADGPSGSKTIEVPADLDKELAFEMKPAGRMRGQISDVPDPDYTKGEYYFLVLEEVVDQRAETEASERKEVQKTDKPPPRSPTTHRIFLQPGGGYEQGSLRPATYKVWVERQGREALEERRVPIGEVRIQPGQVEVFDASYRR